MIIAGALGFLNSLIDILNYPTMNEWVRLKSSLVCSFNTRFLCSECLKKYPTQPDRLERERRAKSCFSELDIPIFHEGELQYKKCPGNFFSDSAAMWIEYHNQFEKGIMPFSGGYFEQPAKAIQTMRIIGNYKMNWEIERAKTQAAKQSSRLSHGR